MFILFIIMLIGLPLWRMKFLPKDCSSCLSISQTASVRGLLVLLIFYSHFFQRVTGGLLPFGDSICISIVEKIGQMMVAPFLFYSGYGIMVSYMKKKNYIDSFPKNRILKTYLFFAFAVLIYLFYNIIAGNHYGAGAIALAFLGYDKIGNPNWFMFVILLLYIVVYLLARLNNKRIDIKTIACVFLFTISYVFVFGLFLKRGQTWWYNTIICFPFGMLIGLYREAILKKIKSHRALTLLLCLAAFAVMFLLRLRFHGIIYAFWYNCLSCSFCLLITSVCTLIGTGNPILSFLGKHSFSIYVFQMIPFSIFSIFSSHPVPFFLLSFTSTIIIALLFDSAVSLFEKRKHKSRFF